MSNSLFAALGDQSGVVIPHKGKDFKVHPVTDELRGKYQEWVHRFVYAGIEAQRKYFSPLSFRELRADIALAIACGEIDFGTARFEKVSNSTAGRLQWFRLVLHDDSISDADLIDFVTERDAEFDAAMRQLNGEPEPQEPEDPLQDPKDTTPPQSTKR